MTWRGDVVISGIIDTIGRQDGMDLIAYIVSGPTFFTFNQNSKEFSSRIDLCGHTVAGSGVSTAARDVQKWSVDDCVTSDKPAIKFATVAKYKAVKP